MSGKVIFHTGTMRLHWNGNRLLAGTVQVGIVSNNDWMWPGHETPWAARVSSTWHSTWHATKADARAALEVAAIDALFGDHHA